MNNFVIASIHSDDSDSKYLEAIKNKLNKLMGNTNGLLMGLNQQDHVEVQTVFLGGNDKFVVVSIHSEILDMESSVVKELEDGLSKYLNYPVGVFVLGQQERIEFRTIERKE